MDFIRLHIGRFSPNMGEVQWMQSVISIEVQIAFLPA